MNTRSSAASGNLEKPFSIAREPRVLAAVALSFLAFLASGRASAQSVTFAQFLQKDGNQNFTFTNNGPTDARFMASSFPVLFLYFPTFGQPIPADLQGLQHAHLTMSCSSRTPVRAAPLLIQPVDVATCRMTILRDTAAAEGTPPRRNLLTIVYTGRVSGSPGSTNASFTGSTGSGDTVTFTSDFFDFSSAVSRGLAFSFSSVSPPLGVTGSFLSSFTTAGTGTFNLTLAPTRKEAPTVSPIGKPSHR